MTHFTHLNEKGEAQMVDVGEKNDTRRKAIAKSRVFMRPETLSLIQSGGVEKGDVLAVARIAGIQAAKLTPQLIPLCHPLLLTKVEVDLSINKQDSSIDITAICQLTGKTGVEMEALTAASVAALTIYDMCKAVDKGMVISEVCLEHKSGGKSGVWQRSN